MLSSKHIGIAMVAMASSANAKCPFGYGEDELAQTTDENADIGYPSQIMTCPKNGVLKTPSGFS